MRSVEFKECEMLYYLMASVVIVYSSIWLFLFAHAYNTCDEQLKKRTIKHVCLSGVVMLVLMFYRLTTY